MPPPPRMRSLRFHQVPLSASLLLPPYITTSLLQLHRHWRSTLYTATYGHRASPRAMAPQRYERVSARLYSQSRHRHGASSNNRTHTDMVASQIAADDTDISPTNLSSTAYPNSPPPSFRSRNSSRRQSRDDARQSEEERDLNDAFDAPSDDDDDDQDQRRLISHSRRASADSPTAITSSSSPPPRPSIPERRVTEIPVFTPSAPSTGTRVIGGGSSANDGVFANITAKPRAGEDLEEKPPTYEQAAADATPPYWETTVLSPYASTGNPDDVFVDGLLVGSFFSFIWNALISMSFQLIGFLLTYLLHTTHAAKHGSRAGLGITLVQYGFQMRYAASGGGPPSSPMDGTPPPPPNGDQSSGGGGVPPEPNKHDFDPAQVGSGADGSAGAMMTTGDWLSYVLMIVGWFILIRAVSDFMRARRQEALVRSSPDRGLGVAVVAEGEEPERAV